MIVDEIEVIRRCQQGDHTAFASLMEGYQSYAFALAVRLLCHEEDALDVVQETFIRVWKHIPSFDPRRKFSTWLYTIATNLCMDRLRQRARMRRYAADDASEAIESAAARENLEVQQCNADLIRRLKFLAARLTETQRLVFTLRDLQELSIREVADITGLSRASVKVHTSLARKRLRHYLTTEELETG